ncbi:cytochrome P450 [Amylostereum chailletii]|nr:cytochrome P450 [Amylostereum chailletii]
MPSGSTSNTTALDFVSTLVSNTIFPVKLGFIGLLCASLYVLLSFVLRKNLVDKDGHPIPPGPPFRYAYLKRYHERTLWNWAKEYGPIYSVWMGNQLMIVINDATMARDLLVNHGALTSSRRQYFLKDQTILRGLGITSTPYGDTWRHHRKIAMQQLTPKAVAGYTHILDYESHILARSLYYEGNKGSLPINPALYVARYSINNMLNLSFGTRTASTSDPLTDRAISLANEFMKLSGPFSNPIDFIEPLQWIPTPLYKRGVKLHDDIMDAYGALIKRVQTRLDAGEDVPDCLVKTLLLTREKEGLSWEATVMLSSVFTLGGVHSMTGILLWFLALIPSYPDVQARAHEELDRVVGREHWPTAEDEKSLPYVRAIIKEVSRTRSPFWVGTPHYSTEDFVYNGMFIPKNTSLVLNIYALHHNQERYPDASAFNPDRYLGDDLSAADSANLTDATQRDHFIFGAGRRICPGIHVAEREMWLAISRLLWTFRIETDAPIVLDEYAGANGRTPMPYKVRLVPRHDKVHLMTDEREEVTLFDLSEEKR